MFTKREKAIIKRHYPHLRIRFMARGVMAQKQAGGAWGLLYSNKDARAHIDTRLGSMGSMAAQPRQVGR